MRRLVLVTMAAGCVVGGDFSTQRGLFRAPSGTFKPQGEFHGPRGVFRPLGSFKPTGGFKPPSRLFAGPQGVFEPAGSFKPQAEFPTRPGSLYIGRGFLSPDRDKAAKGIVVVK